MLFLEPARAAQRRSILVAAALALGLGLGLSACRQTAAEAAPAPPLSRTPDGRPLKLAFADDFDSFRRWRNGQGVWRTTFRDGRDVFSRGGDDEYNVRNNKWGKEVVLYVDPDMRGHRGPHRDDEPPGAMVGPPLGLNPFRLHDGQLDIVGERAPPRLAPLLGGFRYTSGLITTQPSFSQTYGYFEMRARLPGGKGLWPAFWLLPADQSWPPEIDVLESVGDAGTIYVNLHSKAAPDKARPVRVAPGVFHVFAVSWDPRQIVWYVDGREVDRRPTPADMHKPMFMLVNLAMGGDWAGSPDASTPFPAVMTVDYIRAYRFAR